MKRFGAFFHSALFNLEKHDLCCIKETLSVICLYFCLLAVDVFNFLLQLQEAVRSGPYLSKKHRGARPEVMMAEGF